jgi:ligand-binding SRPBCC domain-containing protein
MSTPDTSLVSSSVTALPRRGTFELTTRAWIPRPVDEVFRFFADAHNLNVITPPFLHFRILTPAPIAMGPGALIDYRIRLRGVPISWRTRIYAWEPPYRFADEQVRGPYRLWQHTHTFVAVDGGTMMDDRVQYRVLGGGLVHTLFVQRDLRRIFRYRLDALRQVFGCAPSPRDQDVLIRRIG